MTEQHTGSLWTMASLGKKKQGRKQFLGLSEISGCSGARGGQTGRIGIGKEWG